MNARFLRAHRMLSDVVKMDTQRFLPYQQSVNSFHRGVSGIINENKMLYSGTGFALLEDRRVY